MEDARDRVNDLSARRKLFPSDISLRYLLEQEERSRIEHKTSNNDQYSNSHAVFYRESIEQFQNASQKHQYQARICE